MQLAGSMFPAEYYGTIFVAQRGSWNRDKKIGYRVLNIKVDPNGTTIGHSIFVQGFVQGADTEPTSGSWGMPDLLIP